MDTIHVPYIAEDGKLYLSPQPKISPARRPQRPSNAPDVIAIPLPKSNYTMTEMIEVFEARHTLHEEEFSQPSKQSPVTHHRPSSEDPEHKILFITKRFASVAGAVLGYHEELAISDVPVASPKPDFPTLIQDYVTARGVLDGLIQEQQAQGKEQTTDSLALCAFSRWLTDKLQAVIHTNFGQSCAALLLERPSMNPARSRGPDAVVGYMEQILDACLTQITDRAAGSKEIEEVLNLQAVLKDALPRSMSTSITHYIDGLVDSVGSHVARRAVIQPALESQVH